MQVTTDATAAAIHGWLQKNVTGDRPLADDLPLLESGILTSLQTVELVLFLEERFGITVADDDFVEENFNSVSAIAAFVTRKLS
jgi:acyl carrier protein